MAQQAPTLSCKLSDCKIDMHLFTETISKHSLAEIEKMRKPILRTKRIYLLTFRLPFNLPNRELTLTIRALAVEGFINGIIA